MNSETDKNGASVRFPPPLVFLLFIFAAYAIHTALPVAIGNSSAVKYGGAGLAVLGLVTIVLVSLSFKRASTSIEPWKPTTAIISTGLFAYSRNPIYVAFSLVTIGVGLILNSAWVLLSFLPSSVLVYFIAIRKEEIYLEKKFGAEYLEYKARIRRWL